MSKSKSTTSTTDTVKVAKEVKTIHLQFAKEDEWVYDRLKAEATADRRSISQYLLIKLLDHYAPPQYQMLQGQCGTSPLTDEQTYPIEVSIQD